MSPVKQESESAGSAAVVPASNKRPVKPDDEAFKKELDSINKRIDELKLKQAETQAVISGGDGIKGSFQAKRQELRDSLAVLIKQRNELGDSRTKLVARLKQIQDGIKKRTDDIRASKDKLGVKSVEEIDSQIATLEREIQAGSLTLFDEKKKVQEISNLKKSRKVLEGFSSQAPNVNDEKKEMDEIREKLTELDTKRNPIQKEIQAKKVEVDAFEADRKEKMGSMTDFINQKQAIKAEIDAEYDKLKKLRADNKTARDEYYAFVRVDRERKQAAYEAKRQADKDAKLASQLEAELEAADFPAYADEINTCTTLIAFFEGVLDPSKKMSGGVTVMTKESTTAVAASNLRQVDNSMPEGVVLLKKKDDRDEEDYYFSNKKKSGKGAKGKGVSSSDSTTTSNASSKSLKLDIVMMSQLAKLSIDIPSSTADVERVIGALAAKKSNYETNQATKTAENKKRALEKITALKGRIAAGEDVNAVLDSAAATETEVEAN